MQGPLDAVPIALIVIVGIFAPLVGWVARQRARNPAIWFVYGALAGPFALGLLFAAPLGRCPDCETPVAGWPATCAACGAAVGGLRASLAGNPPAPPRPASVQISTSGPTSPPATTGARVPVIPLSDAAAGPSPAIRMAGAGTSAVPASASASASGSSDTASERVLATGVYLSGNAGMEVGALYAIARVDDHIRVFGPVDAGQLTVRFERRLDDAEITGLDDRIVITGRSGRTPPSFVLRAVGGMRGPTLEAALATGTHGDVVQGSRR